jgi:tRNA-splicing ligase RtcB
MSIISFKRLSKSLLKLGIKISQANGVYQISAPHSDEPLAEILLPENMPLEKKAIQQLCSFATVTHPDGGMVKRALATPDFHSGSIVPVGAVVATTSDMVIPQAIGTDIHCGMRLHIIDVDYDYFMAQKEKFINLLKGDLLLGTRNIPTQIGIFKALFDGGIHACLEEYEKNPLAQMSKASFTQLKEEAFKIFECNDEIGDSKFAPDYLTLNKRDVIRDSYLATLGGGNHFLEIQRVEQVFDKKMAFDLGVHKNKLAFMIHTGSRGLGQHIGGTWISKAKNLWPKGLKHPESGIYPLHGEFAHQYLKALNTASNYAKLNRLMIAEITRLRLREVFGSSVEAPLIHDAPHNIIFNENNCFVHRKGATPAFLNQPVLIPGSMGALSYLMKGLGNESFLNSASHGAGRLMSRFDISRKYKSGIDVGLSCVECITLKEERKIEEAPLAYKDINEVIGIQQNHGIVSPVASFKPILTFKG